MKLTITVEPDIHIGWVTVTVVDENDNLILKGGDLPDQATDLLRGLIRAIAKE